MNKMEFVKSEWKKGLDIMMESRFFSDLMGQKLSPSDYAVILKQIYLQVREHPQALARFASNLRGPERKFVKSILGHALSEVNHDLLAIDDLSALGELTDGIELERPNPTTLAMLGYLNMLLDQDNRFGMLGYLFHHEFMATQLGESMVESLSKCGVPESAMTFIKDHAHFDIGHNKLLQQYIDEMVKTEDDLQSIAFAAKNTAKLYGMLCDEALELGRRSVFSGLNMQEKPRDNMLTEMLS